MTRKRMLVIGGGVFVGRAIVRQALQAGWELHALTRGKSKPGVPAGAVEIRGDRMDEDVLARLAGQPWDAVLDTCAYLPGQMDPLIKHLLPVTQRLVLISTISVYREPCPDFYTEKAPLLDPVESTEFKPEDYGGLKVACENRLLQADPDKAIVLRPGLITGVEDPSDRFNWWARQMLAGGAIHYPAAAGLPMCWTDVESLAAFCLRLLDDSASGVFHMTGPRQELLFPDLLKEMARVFHPESCAGLIPVDEQACLKAGLRPWVDLPLWVPEELASMNRLDCSKALEAGWKHRALSELLKELLEGQEQVASHKRNRDQAELFSWLTKRA